MDKDLDFFLETILFRGHPIQQITASHNFESLTHPDATNDFAAVCYHFTIICECAIQIKDHYPAAFRQITAGDQIIGMRIWLTHRFYRLNPEIIWDAAHQHLAILMAQARAILNQQSAQLQGTQSPTNPTQETKP